MKVHELIEFLKRAPQDLDVVYKLHSEQCILNPDDIELRFLCEPRSDGWVQNKRPDMPSKLYLVFPGN